VVNAPLEIAREDGLAILTIRREEKRNALHGPLWRLLKETAVALAADPPRAVIVTGAGGHFSSGMDLGLDNDLLETWMPALQANDQAKLTEVIVGLKAVPEAIARIPCPVIAAIEGACAGGGLEIALACDLRVAGAEAFFSLPETRLGMIPDVGGTVRAVRLLGRARASELVLTGRRISTAEAEAWGLVSRVVEEGGALACARQLADAISKNGPQATRAVLDVLRGAPGLSDEEAFAIETRAGVRALLSGECIEGIQAFLQKRPAAWSR
jgi:enoyl-CoA hydratase/carnithine racemase